MVISTPAGRPSKVPTKAGPCDSPAVSHLSMLCILPCCECPIAPAPRERNRNRPYGWGDAMGAKGLRSVEGSGAADGAGEGVGEGVGTALITASSGPCVSTIRYP